MDQMLSITQEPYEYVKDNPVNMDDAVGLYPLCPMQLPGNKQGPCGKSPPTPKCNCHSQRKFMTVCLPNSGIERFFWSLDSSQEWITEIICPPPPPWSCPGGWGSAGSAAFSGAASTFEGGPMTVLGGAVSGGIFGCFTGGNPEGNPFDKLTAL